LFTETPGKEFDSGDRGDDATRKWRPSVRQIRKWRKAMGPREQARSADCWKFGAWSTKLAPRLNSGSRD
jgi:hypothetical protein